MTRLPIDIHSMTRLTALPLLFLLPLSGCRQAPAFSLVGSIFPDWIFCSLIGLIAGPVAHALFARLGLDKEIQPPLLIYTCIVLSCTFTLWLVLFS